MKGYIKDSQGRFHLVDKDNNVNVRQDPIVVVNEQKALTLEERLVRLERIVLNPRK